MRLIEQPFDLLLAGFEHGVDCRLDVLGFNLRKRGKPSNIEQRVVHWLPFSWLAGELKTVAIAAGASLWFRIDAVVVALSRDRSTQG